MTAPTYGSLFSGYGGLDLAVEHVFGARGVWHSEVNPDPAKVYAHHWPDVPNLGDITAIDWEQVEPVDIICGGFPCQDISSAGKGAGIKEGTRSGLWYPMADAVRVLRPGLVVVENVAALLARGLNIVLGDLAELGYDAGWACVPASAVGAPHRRLRTFILARAADAADLGHERSRRARDGWAGSADRSASAPDAERVQPQRWGRLGGLAGASGACEGDGGQRQRVRDATGDRRTAAADTHNVRRQGG